MTSKMRSWICRRLGCLNIYAREGITREERLEASTQHLDRILGRLQSSADKLETAVTDINIQKHALEVFAKDITK